MGEDGPRSEVFTTMLVNAAGQVADWSAHHERLRQHGERLRMKVPDESPQIPDLEPDEHPWRLLRLAYTPSTSEWTWSLRSCSIRNERLDAISVLAPRWNQRTTGCKHGDWNPYLEAHDDAIKVGADVALLVHEHSIIDADRGTPILLDEDGTVWMAGHSQGGVDGITAMMLESALPGRGFPVLRGKLNERLVARCHELVVVGSGLGVCRIESLDDEPLGESELLSSACQSILDQHFTDDGVWTALRP